MRGALYFSVNFVVLAQVLFARDGRASPMVIKCYLLFSLQTQKPSGKGYFINSVLLCPLV